MSVEIKSESMLKRLYNQLLTAADKPTAVRLLVLISFLESSVFPLPPDLMLIPMILANRAKAWIFAALCSLASIVGGIVGYILGYFLFESIGQWIIHTYGLETAFQNFQNTFQEWGFWIIMAKGLTPIPYKLVTIASGVCKMNINEFLLASIITRTARFYLLGALIWFFGTWAREFIEKYLGLILGTILVMIVLGFLIVKNL